METLSPTTLDSWYVWLLELDYAQVVNLLLRTHGRVQRDYFSDATCQIRTPQISRTWEGLCIHHIDEDKVPGLSNPEFASKALWKYQWASHLVYCNLLEHLILHIKIYQGARTHVDGQPPLGLYGAKKIMKQIDDFYCGEGDFSRGEMNLLYAITNLRAQYLLIVEYACKNGIFYVPRTLHLPYSPPTRPTPHYSAQPKSSSAVWWIASLLVIVFLVAVIIFLV